MNMFDEDIRGGYSTHMQPTSPCITAELLEDFCVERLSVPQMDEIRLHIASCERCLDLSREYCDFWDVPAETEEARTPRPDHRSEPKVFRLGLRRRPVFQAASVVLVLLGAGLLVRMTRTPGQRDAVRSTIERVPPELMSPRGELQRPPRTLEWRAVPSADHYEVEIQDARFITVWKDTQVKDSRAVIPDSVVEAMQDGSFGWRATAVTADGRRAMSPFATFQVHKR